MRRGVLQLAQCLLCYFVSRWIELVLSFPVFAAGASQAFANNFSVTKVAEKEREED